ncbi:hypothetical protein [Streptomyces sp. NRRL S-495]|uniref:hypothetical protein n=1 Tax=Streptomyces sp. NRRL S-495 TaxID=1609133 RepID=UPI0005F95F53|nr:hypothetical protein [Streptomyces sp. NRRL S-495]KJY32155.1 hypothetical protein VR45_23345 [Streptomyces sp. NRRL S-495]
MTYIAFDAPSADEAYAEAPEFGQEAMAVAQLVRELEPGHRPAFYPPVTAAEQREVLLRLGAVHDRRWWTTRNDGDLEAARESARRLMAHDLEHGDEVAGAYPPGSVEWRGGPDARRAYLRQEYLVWLTGVSLDALGG